MLDGNPLASKCAACNHQFRVITPEPQPDDDTEDDPMAALLMQKVVVQNLETEE